MRYARDIQNRVVDALKIQTSEARREDTYFCPECDEQMSFVQSPRGDNHFRHRPRHEVCVLSSMLGQKKAQKKYWIDLLRVKITLKEMFDLPDVEQHSSLHWETPDTMIRLLPFYYPERQLISLHNKARERNKQLLLLVARIFTAGEFENIAHYGNLRTKGRAIYTYAYEQSIPPRLIITNGYAFYQLYNPRKVWSTRFKKFCTTLFDYEILELGLHSLFSNTQGLFENNFPIKNFS